MNKTATKQDVDDVLAEVRNLADMTHENFMQTRQEAQETREDVRRMLTYLDGMAKRIEISDDERLVMGHQIDRAFGWLKVLADKIGVELKT